MSNILFHFILDLVILFCIISLAAFVSVLFSDDTKEDEKNIENKK